MWRCRSGKSGMSGSLTLLDLLENPTFCHRTKAPIRGLKSNTFVVFTFGAYGYQRAGLLGSVKRAVDFRTIPPVLRAGCTADSSPLIQMRRRLLRCAIW